MATLAPELQVIERVHTDLGLQLKQIATIVGADESTLHRWLSGATPSGPRKVYRSRLAALEEFDTELRDAFSSLDAARRWLWEARPPLLGGQIPVDVMLAGKLERVTALLWSLNAGLPT